MRKYPEIQILPEFCLMLAVSLLLLPIRFVAGWLCAVALHEAAHYIAFCLCSVNVVCIRVGFSGAIMEVPPVQKRVAIICAAAGPLGSLIGVLLFKIWPIMSFCALIQATYNLLPFFPMDGGRILLLCLQKLLGEERGSNCMRITQLVISGLLSSICVFLVLLSRIDPVMGVCVLAFLIKTAGKMTCKQSSQIVQ